MKKIEQKSIANDTTENVIEKVIDKVPIYQSEIDAINQYSGNTELQRLLFAILVMSKRNKKYGNVWAYDRHIAIEGGVRRWNNTAGEIIQEVMTEDDWIDGYMVQVIHVGYKKDVYNVLFREQDEINNTPVGYVYNNEKAGDVFPYYFREGLYCEICDKKILYRTNSRQKYCAECGKKHRREYVAQKVREHRKSKQK